MKTYKVKIPFSGYSRGYVISEIEAASEEEAIRQSYDGIEVERVAIRDDSEYEWSEAEII